MPARTRRPATEVETEAAAAVAATEPKTETEAQPADVVVDEQPKPKPPPPPVLAPDDPDWHDPFACRYCRVMPGQRHLDDCARPDGNQPDVAALPVQVLFSRAMGEVGAISKDGQITEGPQRYKFRGIEQVQQRLQPILVRHGLVILPTTLDRIDHPVRTTRSGGSMYAVALHVRFTVYGPAGDSLEMDAWGEGADSGDKSSGKAHSMAYKTAMLEAFCIPTETDTDDGDRTRPEDTFSDEQRQRAQRAWGAALEATDEPTLAGVRHRAQALLEVPVEVDGQTMPLDQAFTGRRRFITAQQPPAGES